jgi:hypothetical protein
MTEPEVPQARQPSNVPRRISRSLPFARLFSIPLKIDNRPPADAASHSTRERDMSEFIWIKEDNCVYRTALNTAKQPAMPRASRVGEP